MLALPLGAVFGPDSLFFFVVSPFSLELSAFVCLRSILVHGAMLSSASNVAFGTSPSQLAYSQLRYCPPPSALCSRCKSTARPEHLMEPSACALNLQCLETLWEESFDRPVQLCSSPILALISWPG